MCQPLSLGSAAFSFFEWHWFSNSPARLFRGFSHKTNRQKDYFCCCCSWNCSFNFYAWQIRPAKNLTVELTRENWQKESLEAMLTFWLFILNAALPHFGTISIISILCFSSLLSSFHFFDTLSRLWHPVSGWQDRWVSFLEEYSFLPLQRSMD